MLEAKKWVILRENTLTTDIHNALINPGKIRILISRDQCSLEQGALDKD
jgi:hypothetical protein